MIEAILWTAGALLVLMAVVLAVLFRTPATPTRTGRVTRDLNVHRLVDRLRPEDHILVTEKPGRPVGKRGGTHTVFLGLTRKGMQCRTTPLSRPFHRDPGDLVRLLGCGP